MRLSYLLLSSALLLCLCSCSPNQFLVRQTGELVDAAVSANYYYGHNDKSRIYYWSNAYLGDTPKELADVDAESFEVLTERWAKDAGRVYYRAAGGTPADPDTVVVFPARNWDERDVIMDSAHVYYWDDGLHTVEGADPGTFVSLGQVGYNVWGVDRNHVYLFWERFDADAETFRTLNRSFAMDKNCIYYGIHEDVTGLAVDTGQIQVLNDCYIYTDTALYFYADRQDSFAALPIEDPRSIEILHTTRWLRVDGRIVLNGHYYDDPAVDGVTLEPVGALFFRDKNHVFFCGVSDREMRLIPEADVTTFAIYGSSLFARDQTHVYYRWNVLEGADPAAFHYDEDAEQGSDGENTYDRYGERIQ